MTIAFVSAGTFTKTGGTSQTFTLTMAAGETVVVAVTVETTGTAITSSISGGGLTWVQRGVDVTNTIVSKANLSVWYAYSAAGITSQTITVTTSGTMDDMAGGYSRFTGVYNPRPWDPNGSVPASTITVTSTTASLTVSTTNPHDYVLLIFGANANLVIAGTPSNIWNNQAFNALNLGGSVAANTRMYYGPYTAAQHNLVVSETSPQNRMMMIVDALTADQGGTFFRGFP